MIANAPRSEMDRVIKLIKSTSKAEIVEADANQVRFCGRSPRRTFEITREGAGGFRVKETTGWQTAGRSGQPAAYGDRDVISEKQMMEWVLAQLNELEAA
jgi:hypothetical protein